MEAVAEPLFEPPAPPQGAPTFPAQPGPLARAFAATQRAAPPALVVEEEPEVPEEPPVVEDREAAAVDSWAGRLLAVDEADALGDARRAAQGLGLAAVYGLALGARIGGAAFLKSAALVPAAFAAACAFGLPALYIGLGVFDAPVTPRRLFASASRAVAAAGVTLAGLAPLAALYAVSTEGRSGAALFAATGLAAGSLVGLRTLVRELFVDVKKASEAVRLVTVLATFGFALFAAAASVRVWGALPIFTGGR